MNKIAHWIYINKKYYSASLFKKNINKFNLNVEFRVIINKNVEAYKFIIVIYVNFIIINITMI